MNSKQPIIIAGGGVIYSEAEKTLSNFASKHNIPVVQTVMGLGSMTRDDPYNTGPVGVLGGTAGNNLSKETDLVIAVGTKLGDFTTGSWTNFENKNFKLLTINVSRFDAHKHLATPVVSDAKLGLEKISEKLINWKSNNEWYQKSRKDFAEWNE